MPAFHPFTTRFERLFANLSQTGVVGQYRLEDCIASTEKRFMGLWGPVLLLKLVNYEYKVS